MSVQSPKTGEASRYQKQAIVISFMGEKRCDDRTSRCQESPMKNNILKVLISTWRKQNNKKKKRSDRSYNSGLYVEGKLQRKKREAEKEGRMSWEQKREEGKVVR